MDINVIEEVKPEVIKSISYDQHDIILLNFIVQMGLKLIQLTAKGYFIKIVPYHNQNISLTNTLKPKILYN